MNERLLLLWGNRFSRNIYTRFCKTPPGLFAIYLVRIVFVEGGVYPGNPTVLRGPNAPLKLGFAKGNRTASASTGLP